MAVLNADQNQGAELCVWSASSVWDSALPMFHVHSCFS